MQVFRRWGMGLLGIFLMANSPEVQAKSKINSDEGTESVHKFALGTSVSTLGFGGNVAYAPGKKVVFLAGFEQMSFAYPFSFDEDDISYDADLNYKTGSASLLANYYPVKFFYFSGGVGLNLFNPEVDGSASEDWKYGDIFIPAESVGEFHFDVEPSLKLSPYVGVGFGRKVSFKHRLAFSFELGSYYQGPPKVNIEATGLLSPTADPVHGQKEQLEKNFSQYKFYPVVKFGISYVLF